MIAELISRLNGIPVYYRLNQEGYAFLVSIFFVFFVAIVLSNILALILTLGIRLYTKLFYR